MRPAIFASLIAAVLTACGPRQETPGAQRMIAAVLTGEDANDVHSRAEPLVARVTHVDLDLTADFATRTLAGIAALDVLADAPAAWLTLDTRDLIIESVTDGAGVGLDWQLGAADPLLGAGLRIALGTARRVQVKYRTSPGAEALQWLTPAQTAGGRHPYLFSQGQAILNGRN